MKKLYLGGCPFGAGNIGDDAILSSLVNNFGINDNELTICISAHSNNSDYINEYISKKSRNIIAYKNKSYSKPILGISLNSNRYPIQGIVNHYLNKKKIRNKDLLICGGGTLVTDMPWHMVKVLDIAQSQNVPAILFGVGMAEIKDKSTLHKLTKTLNLLEDIYVRDSFVKNRLISIGIREEKVKISFDPAITLSPSNNLDLHRYLSQSAIDSYKNTQVNIGITLSSEPDVRERTNFKAIETIIRHLIKKFNATIFLIPTNCNNNLDWHFMRPLLVNSNVYLIKERFIPEDLITFSQKFTLILSSRLHMNILASIAGIPFVGLIRNSKIEDYSNLHNLRSFPFHEVDSQDFINYLDYLISNYSSLKPIMLKKVIEMRNSHFSCIRDIFNRYLQ